MFALYVLLLGLVAFAMHDVSEPDAWSITLDRLINEGIGLGDPTSFAIGARDIYETGWIRPENAWIFNLWPPAFPMLEAWILMAFGRGALLIAILQTLAVLLHASVALALYVTLRRHTNTILALVAAVVPYAFPVTRVFLLHPTGVAMGETFAVGFFSLGMLASISAVSRPSLGYALAAGIALSLSAYFRSQFEIILTIQAMLAAVLLLLLLTGILRRYLGAGVPVRSLLCLILIVVTAQGTMLPWRMYHLVQSGSAQWVFTSELTARNAVMLDADLTAAGGGFVVSGGGTVVCHVDPQTCGRLDQAQSLFFRTFLENPIEWLVYKASLLPTYWFSPVGAWTAIQTGPSWFEIAYNAIFALAIAASVILVFASRSIRRDPAWQALALFNVTLLLAYGAILVFVHFEARYLYFPKIIGTVLAMIEIAILVRGRSTGVAARAQPTMGRQQVLKFVHPTAQVHHGALVDSTAEVGAFTSVSSTVRLGAHCRVGPQCNFGDWPQQGSESPPAEVRIGSGVNIGARVSIYGAVEIGDNVRIGDNVTLRGPLQIGDRTKIFDGAVIGAPGQYPGHDASGGRVIIDPDVTIREFVAVNQPVDSTMTRVGQYSYLMARSQVDHDCELGKHVKLATGVTLGGAVRIDDYAYLGMNCVVHQGRHVGAHTMLGMNSAVLKNVPPFAVVIGPRFTKINTVGLSRRGFTQQAIDEIEDCYACGDYRNLVAAVGREPGSGLQAIAEFFMCNTGKPILSPGFSVQK